MDRSQINIASGSIPYISLDENSISDKFLKELFCEAKKAIICLEIYEFLRDLCKNEGQKHRSETGLVITDNIQKQYKHLYEVSLAIANKIKGRVTITLPDGHVVIDTCKSEGNTYENYVDDMISENHNSRICILQAQYNPNGVSYERKYSSTTYRKEVYVAVRLGPFRNSAGTLRLSIPVL